MPQWRSRSRPGRAPLRPGSRAPRRCRSCPSGRRARRRGSACRRRRRSGCLVVRRRRDQNPGRVEHCPGLGHARRVDVDGRTRAVVLPGDEVVRAVERDGRGVLVVRRRRDRNPAPGRALPRPGLPARRRCRRSSRSDRPARRRGSSCRRRRRSGSTGCSPPSRSRSRPGRARRRPGSRARRRCRRGCAPGAEVLPGDEVVRAVESDGRGSLVVRRRRDRDPGRVEHCPGLADPRAVDVVRRPERSSSQTTR